MFGYTHLKAMESIILKEMTKFHAKRKWLHTWGAAWFHNQT